MKKKIKLEDLAKSEEIPRDIAEFIARERILDFFDSKRLEEIRAACEGRGYGAYKINMPGKEFTIIMKDSLSNALIDPQANDADILRQAGQITSEKLCVAYGKKQLKPLEGNFETSLYRTYINSLLMNLLEYPNDKLKKETCRELGLLNQEITKLYTMGAAAWLGSSDGLEGIVSGRGVLGQINKIGFSGKKEKVDLTADNCYSGSHYTLKIDTYKKQEAVQLSVSNLTEDYEKCENKIVSWIQENASNPTVISNARNLVRLYLNTSALYDKGKPLPLQWRDK